MERRDFLPSLEGIRGYAFLLVFVIHYNEVYERPARLSLYPFFLLYQTAWFLVPIFFVLSGFLITKILLNTRERVGYFRVFYLRRALRILPLYYLTLGVLAVVILLCRFPMHKNWLLYLVYLQNLKFSVMNTDKHFVTSHLWSLALEEQFYLVWPLAIWFLRTEKAVLRFSYILIAACCALRLAWPLFHLNYFAAYYLSPTRMDAILLGAVLAIQYKRGINWSRITAVSKVLIPVVWFSIVIVCLIRGRAQATDYIGVAAMIPAQNLLGAAFVVLALEPNSWMSRVCSKDLICRVGRISYGLYIFHILYKLLIYQTVGVWLTRFMPHWLALAMSACVALAITFALAGLAYRFIEEPAIRWKDRIKYGPRLSPITPSPVQQPSRGTLELAS